MALQGRLEFIDFLRGLAVVLMLFQHAPHYFIDDFTDIIYLFVVLVSRLSLPLFLLISGYSVGLSHSNRAEYGRFHFLKRINTRFIFLILFGLLINAFRFDNVFSINVIHLIAFSSFICGILLLNKSNKPIILCILMLLLYLSFGPEKISYIFGPTLFSHFIWLALSGEYPISTWFIFSLFGLYAFKIYGTDLSCLLKHRFVFYILVMLSFILPFFGLKIDLFSNSLLLTIFMIGVNGLLIIFLMDSKLQNNFHLFFNILKTYGRHALFIYGIHQFFFITLAVKLGLNHSLSIFWVMLIFIAFLIFSYFAINRMEKTFGRI